MQTHVFKTVNGVAIEADVYSPASPASQLPVLVWFHGGGVIMSHRGNIAPHLKRAAQRHQLVLVSLDYRLSPQASLPQVLEDVRDGIAWARQSLPALLPAGISIDPTRLAVGGASAGGYLALLSGLAVSGVTPPPSSILALYPITDPKGPFFTTPQHPVSYNEGRIITESSMALHLDPAQPALSGSYAAKPPLDSDRVHFYTYMIQEANLAHLLFANAPAAKVDDYVIHKAMVRDFPPTFMLHGDIDDKVGIEQAQSVATAMRAQGAMLEYEEIIGGAQHGYDYAEAEEMVSMYTFLKAHL